MAHIMYRIQTAIMVFLATCLVAAPFIAHCEEKRIFVVHSYHREHVSMPKRNNGLNLVLDDVSEVLTHFFYMDTKRNSSLAWKREIGMAAQRRIDAFKPDVVIAFDDNAQEFVTKKYLGAATPQFVFAGVNGEPEDYGFPAPNITGILERVYPDQSLAMLAMINPDIKKVVCISDNSATSDGVIAYIKANEMPLEIVAYEQPATFSAWKQTVRKYQKDPSVNAFLIPLYQTVKSTAGGDRVKPGTVMQWTVKNIAKPVAGLWPFATQDGALCAVTVDLKEHGIVAANMALQIIGGKKAGQIPIVKNKDGYVILNIQAAKRLGVHIPYEIILAADRLIR